MVIFYLIFTVSGLILMKKGGNAGKIAISAGEFDFNEMHYYIFKFKASLLGKWLVGVCGGFEDDDLEPCGHIFSNMQEYNETTAKNECITMVENIMVYWKEQAAKYNNQ